MIGILSIGIVADRLGRRGISPIAVMLGFHLLYFAAQAVIVLRWMDLAVPAWLLTAAAGQVTILAYPWFSEHVGNELAGRANASINFAVFAAAFAIQYLVGVIIGFFPATVTGYHPLAYSWAFGTFLVLQLLAFAWFLSARYGRRARAGVKDSRQP
jgi:MFS family permease